MLPHQFGAPARLVLAPGGEEVAMIGKDGSIALGDLSSNKEPPLSAGEGAGTQAQFLLPPPIAATPADERGSYRLASDRTSPAAASSACVSGRGRPEPLTAPIHAQHEDPGIGGPGQGAGAVER